jgi:diadenosine tetraphosphate (Ap4A) HIT family hydrolase
MAGNDIFCKLYSAWEKDGSLIYQNNNAGAILSSTPVVPGQLIIFPKRHITDLGDFRGEEGTDLFRAFPESFDALRDLYESDLDRIVGFYERLKEHPPFPAAGVKGEEMLKHPELVVSPLNYDSRDSLGTQSFNIGVNMGYDAGQRIDHLHFHLFPRRNSGLGINSAMEDHLN